VSPRLETSTSRANVNRNSILISGTGIPVAY
jgi:hypothetical protein